mmetsp:Transcript_69255/g.129303  ORF Transcript_69255/g.129303 Transcript_69255/m.129303 type:complete len:214 (-) Transcript_69255:387-1028(-)
MRLMFLMTTYCISGSAERRVTRGGVIFLQSCLTVSGLPPAWILTRNFMVTRTADKTTALLACDIRTMTPRSRIISATRAFGGSYIASASKIKTCPHSVHSFSAGKSLEMVVSSSCRYVLREVVCISQSDATAFATTIGLASVSICLRISMKPCSSTSCGLRSKSFAMQMVAVFRTYGSVSRQLLRNGSNKYSVIWSNLMQPIVRTASARNNGL